MESLEKIKRRSSGFLNWLPQNLPSMPHLGGGGGSGSANGHTMKGTWQHVPLPPLPRSSHSLNVVANNAYIFGGEVEARKPVDNDMHVIVLPSSGAPADYYAVKAKPSSTTSGEPAAAHASIPTTISEADEAEMVLKDPLSEIPLSSTPPPLATPPSAESSTPITDKGKRLDTPDIPPARVGHAAAVIGTRIFVFGGRASVAGSSTLEENGRVWVFETKTQTWTYLDPHHSSPVPPARSYHAAVATDKPHDFLTSHPGMRLRRSATWREWAEGDSAEVGIPQRPIAGKIAEKATDEEAAEAGFGTFIIHAGCLADGSRASDVWAFDVHARTWKQLPDAPGPARGGTTLAIANGRIYRFGGFDGKNPIGGQLDVLHLDDNSDAKGEIGISARGSWESIMAPSSSSHNAAETEGLMKSDESWPAPRSVASLSLVQAGHGREYLVLVAGESAPSAIGHAGAGKFHSDVWAFQVPPVAATATSFKDALMHTVGRKTGEGWTRVALGPFDKEDEIDAQGPGPRGWFAAAPLGDLEDNAVFVMGGLAETGERCGDAWLFRLG
ncbi:hypothetical protein GGR50DRAFT_7262 [Xylaria sp. CBS 124048]|nr:hypothetical protein GGR50DRAFT_7262 [Xylaria sp. CBS 124048]